MSHIITLIHSYRLSVKHTLALQCVIFHNTFSFTPAHIIINSYMIVLTLPENHQRYCMYVFLYQTMFEHLCLLYCIKVIA